MNSLAVERFCSPNPGCRWYQTLRRVSRKFGWPCLSIWTSCRPCSAGATSPAWSGGKFAAHFTSSAGLARRASGSLLPFLAFEIGNPLVDEPFGVSDDFVDLGDFPVGQPAPSQHPNQHFHNGAKVAQLGLADPGQFLWRLIFIFHGEQRMPLPGVLST